MCNVARSECAHANGHGGRGEVAANICKWGHRKAAFRVVNCAQQVTRCFELPATRAPPRLRLLFAGGRRAAHAAAGIAAEILREKMAAEEEDYIRGPGTQNQ